MTFLPRRVYPRKKSGIHIMWDSPERVWDTLRNYMSALDVIRRSRGKYSIYFKTLVRKWLKVYLKFDWTINDTCFNGKIACHGMLRFISQTNLCIRKFLDLKRCNSLKSRHRSEVLFFQLFEQAWSAVISYTDLLSASSTRDLGTRVLTISMGKPGIAFGLRHFAWETSENMGCDLWQRNFSDLFSLFSWFAYSVYRFVLPPRQILYLCTRFPLGFV